MKRSFAPVGFVLVFIAGCAAPPGHIHMGDASRLSPGMTRDEVVGTLGKPEFAAAVDREETMMYVASGRSFQNKPFEVKLIDGIVQSYTVAHSDPAKADTAAGTFKQPVAVPWYSAENYEQMVVLLPAVEREKAVPYDEWLAVTAREEDTIRSAGRMPVRVVVEPAEVEGWCRYHSVPLNRDAITAWADMRLGLERGSSGLRLASDAPANAATGLASIPVKD